MTVALLFLWWYLGTAGFLFWVSRDYDVTIPLAIGGMVVGGLMGPSAWLIGWLIHGDPPKRDGPIILIRKRR